MRYVIAGGGAYGSHYVRKLRIAVARRAVTPDEVVVVDSDPDCAAVKEIARLPMARLHVADWLDFGNELWTNRREWADDIWVPAPVAPHLLSDWITTRIAREVGLQATPVVDAQPLPALPFAESRPDGRVLLSHAPGRCPLGCIEPGICAITKDDRWWEMRRTIDDLVASSDGKRVDAVAMFFCKHHCDAGENDVGGIRFKTIFEEGDRVTSAARSGARIGVATFSSCHGVLNLFDLRESTPGFQQCLRCSAEFGCGAISGSGECWCAGLPPVMPLAGTRQCYCPKCLAREVQVRELASLPSAVPKVG